MATSAYSYAMPSQSLQWMNHYSGGATQKQPGNPAAPATQPPAVPTTPTQPQQPAWAPQTPTALPNEGIYEEQQASANQAYQDAMSNLQNQRLDIFHQYGFNPQGTNLDPGGQYGLVQQMFRNQAQQLDTAHEDALSRGFTDGQGLAAQIEEEPRYAQGAEQNNLFSTYKNALDTNTAGQYGAANDLKSNLLQARMQQIQNALSQGDFTPVDYGGSTGDTGNTSGSTGGDGTTTTSKTTKTLQPSSNAHKAALIQHVAHLRAANRVRPASRMRKGMR